MRRSICFRTTVILFLLFTSYSSGRGQETQNMKKLIGEEQVVIFVCEHGSAKSVVAAAHFNKLAKERNLPVRAISRGTNPDEEIAPIAASGLQADGLAAGEEKPKRLSQADLVGAARLVSFCPLPETYSAAIAVEHWNDVPPMSENYDKARARIVERIKLLLDSFKPAK